MRLPRFVVSRAHLVALFGRLKLSACSRCGHVGALNRHGPMRGYSDTVDAIVVRGWRFYCSNRHRRRGCGRTTSVWFSAMLPRFVISGAALFAFVGAAARGWTRRRAWHVHGAARLCLRSGYRLWWRFALAQSHMRNTLLTHSPPPDSIASNPAHQLLEHLCRALPAATGTCAIGDPFAAFQSAFQTDILH